MVRKAKTCWGCKSLGERAFVWDFYCAHFGELHQPERMGCRIGMLPPKESCFEPKKGWNFVLA